jgi:heat shock protein HtpX
MLMLTGMLMLVGFAVGYIFSPGNLIFVLSIVLTMAVVMNLAIYWYADKWVLKMYKAKVVSESEEPELHEIVGRLAKNAGLPKPKVAVVPMDVPNAFATGRSPSKSVVAVTTGAKELLDKEELEGVLGHELAHIKNRDMLINTMAAIIGAVIVYVMWFSLFAGGGRNRGGGGLIVLLALILMPFAAMLVRMGISRTREYGADEGGAKISRKPGALASALHRLQSAAKSRPLEKKGNPSTSHLFIVNPFRKTSFSSLLSSHPPTEERIKRLKKMQKSGEF